MLSPRLEQRSPQFQSVRVSGGGDSCGAGDSGCQVEHTHQLLLRRLLLFLGTVQEHVQRGTRFTAVPVVVRACLGSSAILEERVGVVSTHRTREFCCRPATLAGHGFWNVVEEKRIGVAPLHGRPVTRGDDDDVLPGRPSRRRLADRRRVFAVHVQERIGVLSLWPPVDDVHSQLAVGSADAAEALKGWLLLGGVAPRLLRARGAFIRSCCCCRPEDVLVGVSSGR